MQTLWHSNSTTRNLSSENSKKSRGGGGMLFAVFFVGKFEEFLSAQ